MKKIAIIMATLVAVACVKETAAELHEQGSQIVFGASTMWENAPRSRTEFFIGEDESTPQTRTEYSGKTDSDADIAPGNTFSYERIDWSAGLDKIRVFCAAAGGGHEMSGHADDYLITGKEADGATSKATGLSPVEGNGLQWGTGDHYFYAVYPAPGSQSPYDFGTDKTVNGAYKLRIEEAEGNKMKVYGVIPSWQNVVKEGNVYKPNMNYAYMVAAKKVSAGASSVELDFKPLVTTFEFTLFQFGDDTSTDKLQILELISNDGTPLANRRYSYDGTADTQYCTSYNAQANQYRIYTNDTSSLPLGEDLRAGFWAVINEGNTVESVGYDNTYVMDTVKIHFPKKQAVQLGTEPVKFTFLTLPLEYNDLTLKLTFLSGETRTLDLKQNGAPITVGACKKAYIYNVGVPVSVSYTLSSMTKQKFSSSGNLATNYDGILANKLKSYKTIGVGSNSYTIPLDYTVEFCEATDDGYGGFDYSGGNPSVVYNYSSVVPDWVHGIESGTFSGSVEGVDLAVTVSPQLDERRTLITENPEAGQDNQPQFINNGYGDSHHNAMVALGTRGTTASPYDLSTAGGTASRTTANCYVVDRPGVYSFPLVYGNAIENGATNEAAYRTWIDGASDYCPLDTVTVQAFSQTANTGSERVRYIHSLTDHNDHAITTPYLADQLGAGTFTPEVVWTDEPGLVSDLSVSADRRTLTFTVPEEAITQGNALIAVKDASGTILWSWQIWFYEGSLAPVTVYNGFQVAPVPVGWCDAQTFYRPRRFCLVKITQIREPSARNFEKTVSIEQTGYFSIDRGHAPYYQGGRKDPFPGLLWNGVSQSQTKHLYAGDGTALTPDAWQGTTGGAGSSVTIGTGIQHPSQWYAGATGVVVGSWSKTQFANLWNTYLYPGSGTYVLNDTDLVTAPRKAVKTVYDPSPAGFQVPPIRAFYTADDGFNTTNFTVVEGAGSYQSASGTLTWDGRQYGDLFVPSLGTRHESGAPVGQNDKNGLYWTSSPSHDGSFLILNFSNTGGYVANPLVKEGGLDFLYYFFGAPVLPVVETTDER